MPDYQPISCDLYDWLEIAASWQLPVTLTSRNDRQWDDKIRTIEASEGVEYLLLHSGERLSLAETGDPAPELARGREADPLRANQLNPLRKRRPT